MQIKPPYAEPKFTVVAWKSGSLRRRAAGNTHLSDLLQDMLRPEVLKRAIGLVWKKTTCCSIGVPLLGAPCGEQNDWLVKLDLADALYEYDVTISLPLLALPEPLCRRSILEGLVGH